MKPILFVAEDTANLQKLTCLNLHSANLQAYVACFTSSETIKIQQ
jgi:hypothetical protein